MEPEFKAAIFDFDYTLADPGEAAVDCINFAFRNIGLPDVSAEKVRQTVGLPLSEVLLKLVGEAHMSHCGEFIRSFRKRADEIMAASTIVIDTAPETVRALKTCDLALGIVSTKGRFRIRPILEREGLLDFFDVIIGGEDVSEYKPDPEGLLAAIRQVRCSPSDALYVGDSIVDAETAMRAKVTFVAVLSGVTPKESFQKYPVYAIIETLSQLPTLIGCSARPFTK